jgi:hypothetical protein
LLYQIINSNNVFVFSSQISFVEFLEVIIDRQDDARDIYDEILQGFKMFDQGWYTCTLF